MTVALKKKAFRIKISPDQNKKPMDWGSRVENLHFYHFLIGFSIL